MQNRNEFIQVSKFLLNNLIHSSSFGRNCGLWLMYWARQKVHSRSHLHLIYNCQKTAHQPFPGEEQTAVGFILVNATTEMAHGYSRQGKPQTRMLAAENMNRIWIAKDLSHFSSLSNVPCWREIFQMCCAGQRKTNNQKKKKSQLELKHGSLQILLKK